MIRRPRAFGRTVERPRSDPDYESAMSRSGEPSVRVTDQEEPC